jgi:hypothetical protein
VSLSSIPRILLSFATINAHTTYNSLLNLSLSPNCPYCPLKSSSGEKYHKCKRCNAYRVQLEKIRPEMLKAPDVGMKDFVTVLGHSVSSVSEQELTKYTKWTNKFGREGA